MCTIYLQDLKAFHNDSKKFLWNGLNVSIIFGKCSDGLRDVLDIRR